MLIKKFISKVARETVLNYLTGINSSLQLEEKNWFTGIVSADLSTVVDQDTGQKYELRYTGFPEPISIAYKLSNTVAFVEGTEIQPLGCDSPSNPAYAIIKDDIYFYLKKIGDDKKYYLPQSDLLRDRDYTKFQLRLSSNGKGILIGSVEQNADSSFPGAVKGIYSQIVRYTILKNIELLSYTSEALTDKPISTVTYPVSIDNGNYIVYAAIADIYSNSFDLNSFVDGTVPIPAKDAYPARGIFYPYATSKSQNNAPLILTSLNWNVSSPEGNIFVREDTSHSIQTDSYAHKESNGDQEITWDFSTNSSIFKTFTFTFNNDTDGNYNADLLTTHVNCYFGGILSMNWTTEFIYNWTSVVIGCSGCSVTGNFGNENNYNEARSATFSYTYPSDFAYTLEYLATPDLWVPINTTGTTDFDTWQKHYVARNFSTLFDPISPGLFTPYDYNGIWNFDVDLYSYTADPSVYISMTGDAAAQNNLAYTSSFTLGPPFGGLPYYTDGYGNYPPTFGDDIFTWDAGYHADYYTGLRRTYAPYFNAAGGFWPGFSIWFHQGQVPPSWTDLNYDNLFITVGPTVTAVFAGRSTAMFTDLAGTPKLYGEITQLLGDGADFNTMYSGFRGRSFTDNNNTAYVYKQDFNKIYRFSNPALIQGNLSNISGAGSADLSSQPGSDPYTDAIADLVNFWSIADVFGNTDLANRINTAMESYRNGIVPSDTFLNQIYADLRALSSDLDSSVANLQNQLNQVNQAINNPESMTIIGQDVIGFSPPDVYTDRLFSLNGTWPFPQPGGGYLKGVDSFIIQGYYIEAQEDGTIQETVQSYRIADGTGSDPIGLTSKGKVASGTLKIADFPQVMDYILPIKETDIVG